MSDKTYIGTGKIDDTSDYKYVKWVGRLKNGGAAEIVLENAICLSNPEWKFEEKNETVAEVEFEACYLDSKLAQDNRTEPWSLKLPEGLSADAGSIILGVGRFYVGSSALNAKAVAYTRGGGSFTLEREYHAINADEDPGYVKGRILQDGGRAKLKFSALEFIHDVTSFYAGMGEPPEFQ